MNGYKCDHCEYFDRFEPRYTIAKKGHGVPDEKHFCSAGCLGNWAAEYCAAVKEKPPDIQDPWLSL